MNEQKPIKIMKDWIIDKYNTKLWAALKTLRQMELGLRKTDLYFTLWNTQASFMIDSKSEKDFFKVFLFLAPPTASWLRFVPTWSRELASSISHSKELHCKGSSFTLSFYFPLPRNPSLPPAPSDPFDPISTSLSTVFLYFHIDTEQAQ